MTAPTRTLEEERHKPMQDGRDDGKNRQTCKINDDEAPPPRDPNAFQAFHDSALPLKTRKLKIV